MPISAKVLNTWVYAREHAEALVGRCDSLAKACGLPGSGVPQDAKEEAANAYDAAQEALAALEEFGRKMGFTN